MAPGTFCNMFRADGVTNVTIVGRGRAVLDGGEYNGLGERNANRDGRPPIWVNNLLLFTNVRGFRVENLRVLRQRWWALNFIGCSEGHIQNIDFLSHHHSILGDGTRINTVQRNNYGAIVVKNSDGIDLRAGCHNIVVENITGFCEDDSVALTCLPGLLEKTFLPEGTEYAIRNITVRDVRTSCMCSNVRLLAQGGCKLQNVMVENVEDVSDGKLYMRGRGEAGVNLGDEHLYGKTPAGPGDVCDIVIRNVRSRANVGVSLRGLASRITVENVVGFDGLPQLIRDSRPNMADEMAVTDADGIKWIDGRCLPLEGRMFSNVENFYDRLPKNVTTNVNEGVRTMKHHTAGMQFRFKTSSPHVSFIWVPFNRNLSMDHMPATGVSGIDIYAQDADGRWNFVRTGRIYGANGWPTGTLCRVSIAPETPILVNLPLYNGLRDFRIGIASNATVRALGPRQSGINRPVVFYGTSITHGGCCSRPGLSFVNVVGRDLDVPVVNLGFSGAGKMEHEMSEHLAAIDASCYVLDCLWNMNLTEVADRYEPFVRNLRAKRPDVPIVMAEQCDVFMGAPNAKDSLVRRIYEKLTAEGWKGLCYLPKAGMYSGDRDGTVDGVHPNDLGMGTMAKAFGAAVKTALGLL